MALLHEPSLRTLRLQGRIPIQRTRKGAVFAETATLLADDIQGIEYADTVYPTREGICVQRVYLMDNSKSVSLSSLLLKR
jgi:hypothetical protein